MKTKLFVPLVSSLTAYEFCNSILGIYISSLGAKLVLVHCWDYIFRIWVTVQPIVLVKGIVSPVQNRRNVDRYQWIGLY
jgi:hypothetical protein